MHNLAAGFVFIAAITLATVARSETVTVTNAGDTFVAGAVVSEQIAGPGDTFVAARSAEARGVSAGDLHVAGFDIDVHANTTQDLYAFGARVDVSGPVGQDMTAGGFSVHTRSDATTGGNARLFGNLVKINGPVGGSLTAAGRDIVLNAPVAGDVRITAQTLTFGPDASVSGMLTYSTASATPVPERVAPADRVVFEAPSRRQAQQAWRGLREEMPVLPTFATLLVGLLISLLFFVVLGAVTLGVIPNRLERMRQGITARPGHIMLLGVIGLSILFGSVPITAMTIVGLPFVPIAVLAIIVVWTLGYALGAYSVAMRIWAGLGGQPDPGTAARLLVFSAAIVIIALLNFIPLVGWVANYTLVLLGIGAMTNGVFQSLIGNPGPAFDVDMTPLDD